MRALPSILAVVSLASPGAAAAQRAELPPVPELEVRAQADSNDPVAYYRLALGYLKVGRAGDANRALRTATVIDPQFAAAYQLLAALRPSRPPVEAAALGEFRRAFLLDPLLDLDPSGTAPIPTAWYATTQQALRQFRRGDFAAALEGFGIVVVKTSRRTHPESVSVLALWYHALAAARLGRYEDGIADLERLLERAQDTTVRWGVARPPLGPDEYRYVLAYLHQQAGHRDEAVRRYQELVVRDLGLYAAHSHLAEIFEARGMRDEAITERRRAIAANPEDPSLLFDLGLTLTNAGRSAEAEATLRQAIAANPRESRAQYVLGVVELRLTRLAHARAAFTRFLELAPSRYGDMIADARAYLAQLP